MEWQTRDGIRRLFADIETSPNVVLAFRAGYNLTINHDAILSERKVICIGFKWEWEKKVSVLRWDKNQDDRAMLVEFFKVAEEADEIVAHFGDNFDIPWLRTRCLFHKLDPIPLYRTVDTKAWASKHFLFNSNKLDYISAFLGHGRKLHTDFELWKQVLIDKSERALRYMARYCGIDVVRLESVFHDLAAYVKPKTHVGVLQGGAKWTCSHCGSKNVRMSKRRVTAQGTVQYQMQCRDCKAYYTISEKSYRDFLREANKRK